MKDNLEQYDTSLIIARDNGKSKPKEYNYLSDFLRTDDWQDEKLQKLVSKFNNNVASIWDDEHCSVEDNCKTSIWSFNHITPVSSTSTSPKYSDSISSSIWHSNDITKQEKKSIKNGFSNFWEPLRNSTPVGFTFTSLSANNIDVNNWFSLKCFENKLQKNKTSLTNHRGDSLFVEVNSLKNSSKDEETLLEIIPCIQSATPTTASQSTLILADSENSENLLTSPKTHFQPIKSDSIDNDSEENLEVDAEVARLVPCSSNCPNNEVKEKYPCDKVKDLQIKPRPLSTSLPELASFMGPFSDSDVTENKPNSTNSPNLIQEAVDSVSMENMSSVERFKYKANGLNAKENLFIPGHKNSSTTLVNNEEKNEFEELCTLLNQVLNEDTCSEGLASENDLFSSSSTRLQRVEEKSEKENELSWSCWNSLQSNSPLMKKSKKVFLSLSNVQDDEQSCNKIYPKVDFIRHQQVCNNNIIDNISDLEINYKNKLEREVSAEPSVNWLNVDYYNYDYNNLIKDEDNYDRLIEWSTGDEFNCNIAASSDTVGPGQVFYSWDLEEEWQREEIRMKPYNNKANNKNETHNICKRPCSFFLEGNCRRSDCKFSHDLKSITCKFWEESSCFKGDTCPFLHGYPKYENDVNGSEVSDAKYTIESESDFPSLITRNPDPNSNQEHLKLRCKKEKKESQVLIRMVKKKRRKGGQQYYNEKAV